MANNHINVITGIHDDKYEWTGGWTWETIHDVTTISVHLCANTFISDPWQWSYILFSGLYSLHQATRSMQIILTCALSRPSSESCTFTRTDQRQKRYILCTFLTSFLYLNKKRSCHFDTSGLFHSVSCLSKQKTMHRSVRSPSTCAFSVTSFLDLMAFSIKVKEKSLGKEIECNLIRPQPKIIWLHLH